MIARTDHHSLRVAFSSHPDERVRYCRVISHWSTVSRERLPSLLRFGRWLSATFPDGRDVLGDPVAAAQQTAAFRRWNADPAGRSGSNRQRAEVVHPRLINDDLRAIADLFAFVAANPAEARSILGPSPWDHLTQAHADRWFRQVTRIPHRPALTDRYYVDDHALAQIPAALPLLGLPRGKQMPVVRGDGTQVLASGLDDPQAMRMILLQILTGRRASEIRTCDFDCLSAVPGAATAGGRHGRDRGTAGLGARPPTRHHAALPVRAAHREQPR